MDLWIGTAVRQRREELLAQAAHVRMLREMERRRSSVIRGKIAQTAQTLSDVLAGFAQSMRNDQA